MALKVLLRGVDQALGSPIAALKLERAAQADWQRFEHDRAQRQQRYPGLARAKASGEVLDDLNRNGFAIIRNAVDPEVLLRIKAEMESHLDAGTSLLEVSRDSARTPGDRAPARVFLTPEELSRGQGYVRQHTNYVAIAEPLLTCPSVAEVAFREELVDIASTYLECVPALAGLNLRKSFVNDLADFDTLYFHSDPNSPKFLKFFFYLNDVDENGGPFCYVRGSHHERFRGWRLKYRWTYDEIATAYGKDRILNLTANLGDMIVADTTGFHRGTKVKSRDRSMLTLDYLIHPEFGGTGAHFKVRRSDVERLPEQLRPAVDFLEVVE